MKQDEVHLSYKQILKGNKIALMAKSKETPDATRIWHGVTPSRIGLAWPALRNTSSDVNLG